MRGFQAKLANFLNFNVVHDGAHHKTSIFEQLDLIHDVTFWFAISYSFIMVVTALARYVFHSKNANMSIKGMYCTTYSQFIFGLPLKMVPTTIGSLKGSLVKEFIFWNWGI